MWSYIKSLLRDEGGWVAVAIIASSVISAYMQKRASDQATGAQLQAADRAAA